MNIFVLSRDIFECGEFHCDKHVVKMILETGQLLSTAHRVLDGNLKSVFTKTGRRVKQWKLPDNRDSLLYQSTHYNHPCSIWTRETKENYEWLFRLFTVLLYEYQHRYNKVHACSKLLIPLSSCPTNIQSNTLTPFKQCMPDEYRRDDPIEAYRAYYIGDKKSFAKYTNRKYPFWL